MKFDINNFQKFKDKIKYIVVDKAPPNILELEMIMSQEIKEEEKLILNGMALNRDYFQRENLSKGIDRYT